MNKRLHRRRASGAFSAPAFAAVVWVATGPWAATANAEIPQDLLAQLEADSWEERQRASERLLGPEGPSQAELVAAFKAAADLPETRARIVDALHHRHLREQRLRVASPVDAHLDKVGLLERAGRAALRGPTPGALGVSHRALPAGAIPGVDQPSIAVLQTLPGFPAHGVLRAGDLIIALNGRPVSWGQDIPAPQAGVQRRFVDPRDRLQLEVTRVAAEFSDAVKNAGAGSTVTLRVVRGGDTRELTAVLAPSASLQRLHPGGGGAPDPAWRRELGELLEPVAP